MKLAELKRPIFLGLNTSILVLIGTLTLVMLTTGCQSVRRLTEGPSIQDGAADKNKPFIECNGIVKNGCFDNWPYGESITPGQNDNDTPVTAYWVTHGGGEGTRPTYTVSRAYEPSSCARFDVKDVGLNITNGVRIYQVIENHKDLWGHEIEVSISVKTKIKGKIQFAIDAGGGYGHKYSEFAQGTGQWERITVRFDVPNGCPLLWLKVGMTTKDVTVGTFYLDNASIEIK